MHHFKKKKKNMIAQMVVCKTLYFNINQFPMGFSTRLCSFITYFTENTYLRNSFKTYKVEEVSNIPCFNNHKM